MNIRLIRIKPSLHNSIILNLVPLILLGQMAANAAEKVTIVANPGLFASITQAATGEEKVNFWDDNPQDDAACTESFAAVELRQFLAACTGIKKEDIEFVPPGRMPANGTVFLLGSRTSNPLIGTIDADNKGKLKSNSLEAFRIHAFQQNGRTITIIGGKTRIGTLYGTYDYLERLGMRFYGLGEQGTVYPAKPVSLPGKMDLVKEPKFITRGYYSAGGRGEKPFFLWAARNHMNLWSSSEKAPHPLKRNVWDKADTTPRFRKKLGFKLISGGHGIQEDFLNPNAPYPYNHPEFDKDNKKPQDPYPLSPLYKGNIKKDGKLSYAEAHPEWYAIQDRKRVHTQEHLSRNYCTSNDDATRELAGNLIQSLIDGEDKYSDMIDFWVLDGRNNWCECEQCKKQGTPSDRLLDIQYKVYAEIKKAQSQGRLKRSIQLLAIAYLDTLGAPTKPPPDDFDYENCLVTFFPISRCYAHPLADPTCTEINLHTLKCYQAWATATGRPYKGSMIIGEYYNVSSIKTLPVIYTQLLSADIPWYYSTGVRHLNYMHTPTKLWGTWTLNQRLLAKLLWNPDADVAALVDDYFRLYYPTTSGRTRQFYKHLEYATRNIKAYKHHVWAGGDTYHCLPGKLDNIAKNLFPMDHLKYAPHHPKKNDAPDVVEIIEAMNKARRHIDDVLLECTNKTERLRLLEDERRFAYGEAMFQFLYHLARINTFHHRGDETLARHEFGYVELWAERLRGVTDIIHVSYRHANAPNGLIASQADPAYKFFKKKYAPPDQHPKNNKAGDKNNDPFMAPK